MVFYWWQDIQAYKVFYFIGSGYSTSMLASLKIIFPFGTSTWRKNPQTNIKAAFVDQCQSDRVPDRVNLASLMLMKSTQMRGW
jgi:hypothetical protein